MNATQDCQSVDFDSTELLKIDPEFSKLHRNSSLVAVYRYDASSHFWQNTDVIGSLYLYERKTQPQYGMIVKSTRNSFNFLQQFSSSAVYVLHLPYLLIRAVQNAQKSPGQDRIHCVWFHEPQDCLASANILRNMGLKFDAEGNNFHDVGKKQGQVPLFSNSEVSLGNPVENNLYQILSSGTKQPIDLCDLLGGPVKEESANASSLNRATILDSKYTSLSLCSALP